MRQSANCWSRVVTGLVLCVLPAVLGCSGDRASVSGKVTHRGRTIKSGSVIFVGSDGVAVVNTINEDGTFQIDDITAGEVSIAVTSPSPQAQVAVGRQGGRGAPRNAPRPEAQQDPNWFAIPSQYADVKTSGLTMTLEAGSNSKDIVLP